MKKYNVRGHEPSLLPDGFDFELVWSDEFDGTEVDAEKWDYRLSMMGRRHPAWTNNAVRIENGCAVFSICASSSLERLESSLICNCASDRSVSLVILIKMLLSAML